MYLDYFGLARPPYRITPDTELFYGGAERGDILDALTYAIVSGEAITKVVGEVGSGKTMLCRMLEQKLPGSVEIVYLANPSLPPENVLHAIAFELGLPITSEDNRLRVMKLLQEYLLQRHSDNHQVVVFVEEAQGMPLATLEEIRLLSNLETQHHKLLQVVLFGQPELDAGLKTPGVRQIKERITNSFYLTPLKFSEIRDYLAFRLHLAGFRGASVFSAAATWLITRFSGGLMRRINILADKAMLAAYTSGNQTVTARHVWTAISDCEFVHYRPRLRPALLAAPILAVAMGLGVFTQADIADATLPQGLVATPMEQHSKQATATESPSAQQPINASTNDDNLLQQRLNITQDWLAEVTSKHFTIQVLWAKPDEQAALEQFLRDAKSSHELDQLYVYRAGDNTRGPLNVVFGEFASYAQAKAALESLPQSLKRYQPFLRNVRGVLAEAKHLATENAT